MKKLLIKIIKGFAQRLYPFIVEQEHIRRNSIKSLLKNKPDNFILLEGSFIIGPQYVSIGENFVGCRHFRLEAIDNYVGETFSPNVNIGKDVSFGDLCHIGCIESVTIGDGVMGGSKIYITDHYHGKIESEELSIRPALRHLSHKPVSIGSNVWIGDGVCIMPGVTIGENVIIGANSVVTHSFPDNVVIAGCPAKVIRNL